MKILALDTSTSVCSVGLIIDEEEKSIHQMAPRQQAKLILPLIQELLHQENLKLEDLDAITYSSGPGSFTGIRIASSVAQGIGYAADKPVIPVSSLAVLAQSAFLENHCTKALIAVDARMGQIYWAVYQLNKETMVLIGRESVCSPKEISLEESRNGYGVGDGWIQYGEILTATLTYQPLSIYTEQLPSAKALLHLAKLKFEQGSFVPPSEALPIYLR